MIESLEAFAHEHVGLKDILFVNFVSGSCKSINQNFFGDFREISFLLLFCSQPMTLRTFQTKFFEALLWLDTIQDTGCK